MRNLLDVYERAIAELDAHIDAQLKADPGYQAVMTLPGVGKVIAAVFVAEPHHVRRSTNEWLAAHGSVTEPLQQ